MKIDSAITFVASLNPEQRRYFLEREQLVQTRLQEGLRDIGRGLGHVAGLNGESLGVLLDAGASKVR